MTAIEYLSIVLLLASAVFFLGGTIGLLRFPDTFCRLHALTKADNLGLGLLVLALAPHTGSFAVTLKMVLIWLLVMFFNSGANYLVARHALEMDTKKKKEHEP
jgi:multicomponent Na+:H+ antiporter subunit G